MNARTVVVLSFLLAVLAVPVMAQQSEQTATTMVNTTGTYGDVILDGDTARTQAGVLLRAGATRPDVVAETGSTSGTAGFSIFTSAGSEVMKVRNDGLILLGGSTASNWSSLVLPAIEYKATSFHLGSDTELRLVSNAVWTPQNTWNYKIADAAAMYTIWKGYHLFSTAVPGTAGAVMPYTEAMRASYVASGPRVAIGTYYPNARLHVSGGTTPVIIDAANSNGFGVEFKDLLPEGYQNGVLVDMKGNSLIRVSSLQLGYLGTPVLNSVGANNPLLLNTSSANDVVVGQSGYATKLVVASTGTSTFAGSVSVTGNVNVTGSITGSSVIGAKYQDLAEWVPSESDLEPGTVVVLSRDLTNSVTAAATAYDTSVAGVVSAQPGIILGEGSSAKEMVATTGRVIVKVDATRHPIAIGDLLVSSGRPGHAMKSIPVEIGGASMHRPGTIIGKALEPLAGGEGEILVLLSLQ